MTLVNLTGAARGVAQDETGINIRSFKTSVEPEFKDKLPGKNGEIRGFAVGAMQTTVSIEGEVMGNTGIMALTATTSASVANAYTYFGNGAPDLYLDKGEVTEARDGFKDVSVELSGNQGV